MLTKLKNLLKAEIDPAFAKRAEFIFAQVEKHRPKKILDGGCGRGFYLQAISLFPFVKEIHGIDLNKHYLKVARSICGSDKKISIQKANIYTLPYSNSYFDFIIASEILEHLKDDKKAVLELKRVLKKDGVLIITVPNYYFPFFWDPLNWVLMRLFWTHIDKNIFWLAGIWADHERLYKEKELVKLLKNSGFKIQKVQKYIRYSWPFSHFLLYGVGKNIVERLGVKEFSRFDFSERKLSQILAAIFQAPSKLDPSNIKKTSVSLVVKAAA